MKKTYLIGIILIIILIGIVFTIYKFRTPTGLIVKEIELQKISLGDNLAPASAPFAIAYYKDYFEDEGLALSLKKFTAGRYSLDALLSGNVQIADVADTPLMFYGLKEQEDVCIIATMATCDGCVKLVGRKDKGIKTPADLKGKKIGVLEGTVSQYFLDVFLEKNGIDLSDVKLVNLRPPEMSIALIRGDIDAFSGWEPFVYNTQKELEDNIIVFIDKEAYTVIWNFVVKKEYAKKNPGVIKRFLKAMLKAEEYLENNKDESILITSSYTGLEPEALNEIMQDFDFGIVLDQNSLVDLLEKEAKWAKEKGIIPEDTKIPDYISMVCSDYMRELKPEAVKI